MRYSILGFSQKVVCSLTKTIKREDKADLVLKLDMTDLLILQQLADFPNRKKTKKQIVDDKLFFWVDYKELLEELPILDIKKQALRDRLDKMIELKVLEKAVVNFDRLGSATCFRMGDNYETLLYSDDSKQSTTQGGVANYTGGGSELHDNNNNRENNNNKINTPPTPQGGMQEGEQTELFPDDAPPKKPKGKKKDDDEDFDFKSALLSLNINEDVVLEWMKLRKKDGATNSERSFNLVKRAMEEVTKRLNITPTNVIEICLAKGWYGCQTSYFEKIKLSDFGIAPISTTPQIQANKYEMIDEQGNRYYLQGYGKHKVIIPADAPQRPSETMFWSNFTKSWYQP